MRNKQKPAKKPKAKPSKQLAQKQAQVASIEQLLNEYEAQTAEKVDEFIDALLKRPIKEGLLELVNGLLEYLGVKATKELEEEENLKTDKTSYVDGLMQKANLKPVKETKQRQAFKDFVYRLMRSGFPVDGKASKKNKSSFYDHLTEWLVVMASCKARKVRVEATRLILHIISDLIKETRLLEKAQFKSFFNFISSNFLLPRLNDIDVGIKQDLMGFVLDTIEKADQIFEPGKGKESAQPGPELMAQAVMKLGETSYELKRRSVEFIKKALSSENIEINSQMYDILKSHKNVLLNAVIETGQKEMELYLDLLKDLIVQKGFFDEEDRTKLSLLVYHHNKRIAALMTELWASVYEIDKFGDDTFSEEKLIDFCHFLQLTHKARYDNILMSDYVDLGQRFVPYLSVGSKGAEMVDILLNILTNPSVQIHKMTICSLVGLLVAIAIDKNQKGEPFAEDFINDHFEALLTSKKTTHFILEGVIQLYRFQLKLDDESKFKGRIHKINSLLDDAKDMELIRAIYGLYNKHKPDSDIIAEQLEDNYNTYKNQLKLMYSENSHQPELKYLLYKIRLVIKEFLIAKNVYSDFELVFQVINDYLKEKSLVDTESVVKSCLGIVYECFYSDFLKLFRIKGDFEGHMARHKERRNQVLLIFEQFISFKPIHSDVKSSARASIKVEAFSLLLNLYMLVSKDQIKGINFVYYMPNETHIRRINQYIDQYLFTNKKFGPILQSEHKRYIRNSVEDSNAIKTIEDNEERDADDNLIDKEVDTPADKKPEGSDGEEFGVYKENYLVYKFVCAKLIELLKTCSAAFEVYLNHDVVLRFFIHDKSKMYFRPILQDYLKFLLLQDAKEPHNNRFWSCYYRCLHTDDHSVDLINFSRFFAKVYLSVAHSKSLASEQQFSLFMNFLNCMLGVYDLAFKSKHGGQLLAVLQQVFIREPFFKENMSMFSKLLYKFCMKRQEKEKTVAPGEQLAGKLEHLENYMAERIGLFNKEAVQEMKKNQQEAGEIARKEQKEDRRELVSSTGLKNEPALMPGLYDDGYRIKRKTTVKEDALNEANENTSLEQKRSVKL